MKYGALIALAFAASGCSMFRTAEKDPTAALAVAVADSKKVGNEVAKACADYTAAVKAGLVPAGTVKTDLDAFCAADAAWRVQHP